LHEERNVKWMLVISLIMIPVATFTGVIIYPSAYSYPYREPDALEVVSFYLNRIDVLCFIATMTIATLATTGFGSKALLSRISVYLFLISMALFFVSVLKLLLTPPWVR
jgi:hypothetical protein